jgi:hypothetical protein
MKESKIILIGCSLYSIFLALNLSKKTKKKIIILESSDKFLKSFTPLKIKNVYCNPGFHSFERYRSTNIIKFMKKFELNFKTIKKGRGILISKYLLNSYDNFGKWPSNIVNKYGISKKIIKITNFENEFKILPKKYISYLHKNNSNAPLRDLNKNNLFPWFFPPNYKNISNDEGSKHLEKVRNKNIKQNYIVPVTGLFNQISKKIKKNLKKNKSIEIKYNSQVEFYKNRNNLEVYINNKKSSRKDYHIICTPVFSTLKSIRNFKTKSMKLIPSKYFGAVISINKNVRTNLDKFFEIIVSSNFFPGVRRISRIVKKSSKKYFLIEIVQLNKFEDLKQQLDTIVTSLSDYFITDKNKKFELEGFKIIRTIFNVKNKYVNDIIIQINKFFSKNDNIFYDRKISWPINTKKQFDFAQIDYIKVLKYINDIK